MSAISPHQARAYLDRWRQVDAAQLEIQRTDSVETRLRQLSTLMNSRELFGNDPERDAQVQLVRDRWLEIREASNG